MGRAPPPKDPMYKARRRASARRLRGGSTPPPPHHALQFAPLARARGSARGSRSKQPCCSMAMSDEDRKDGGARGT
eukprot:CAMPEP_0179201814 /NCGR_PEP_ID=MMETSP0796-20121207/100457_1 /TAXON_ID=73915 /ORGANISM="Pyrodinium bahamense, Strain pbaha01" /LENGTH=75 /DNA_ID=CAMNT_0020906403 /DNA_START=24 /DNA_END=247 /DNA_ORIENTATION=+